MGQRRTWPAYDQADDSITFIQYQARAMGGNYQKANKIIYFHLAHLEKGHVICGNSQKRIHRIGQTQTVLLLLLTGERLRLKKRTLQHWRKERNWQMNYSKKYLTGYLESWHLSVYSLIIGAVGASDYAVEMGIYEPLYRTPEKNISLVQFWWFPESFIWKSRKGWWNMNYSKNL